MTSTQAQYRVTFVHLSVFEGVLPLAAGYMSAFARKDPMIRDSCRFDVYDASIHGDRYAMLAELISRRSDVYAFGCYVWNMELVRWLVAELRKVNPHHLTVLGGPQVMQRGERYIAPHDERTLVCNGEGERTMYELLRRHVLDGDYADLTAVPGLSFRHGAELVTNPASPRITDMSELPSPFIDDPCFEPGDYAMAILETNRGCPFRCAFCFWGAATNDRVYRFDTDRVRDEIEWIAQSSFVSLFIVDANWGMLPRDVEITDHIVTCAREYGYPTMVAMASAKNSPARVADITEKLVNGGLLTSQPIALQTVSKHALKAIDRANIREETYAALQADLAARGVSSYTELIWPLPGETPTSYRAGVGDLCRAGADTLLVYPHLLLPNTPLERNQSAYGLTLRRLESDVAEVDVIVGTAEVTPQEFSKGLWFYYGMHVLHNLKGLCWLSAYLERAGVIVREEMFERFGAFLESRPQHPLSAFVHDSIGGLSNYEFQNSGLVAHLVLHEHRQSVDALLQEFVVENGWCDVDEIAAAVFELDLLCRPYIYAESPRMPGSELSSFFVELEGDTLHAELRAAIDELPREIGVDVRMTRQFSIHHSQARKLPFFGNAASVHSASYCQGMMLRMRELAPALSSDAAPIGVEGMA